MPTRKHVLVAVDHDDAPEALEAVARRYLTGHGDEVSALAVTPRPTLIASPAATETGSRLEAMLREQAEARLDKVADLVGGAARTEIATGRPADEIIRAAERLKADLVVKAADRPAGTRTPVFGATEKKLTRKCPVPVLITRGEAKDGPVVVALDRPEGDAQDAAAALREALIRHAADLAERAGTEEVVLLHAWSVVGLPLLEHPRSGLSKESVAGYVKEWEDEHARWLDETVARANERFEGRLRFRSHMVMGDPGHALPEAVADLGGALLVIGSANRSGVAGLFIGNTAETVIDRAPCDVYVVKPEGFETVIASAR